MITDVKIRHVGIDAFRYLAFISVVVLHCLPKGNDRPFEATFIDHITRFAVPFFFVSSGYFLGLKNPAFASGTIRLFRRLAIVFIFWVLIYVAVAGELRHLVYPGYWIKLIISGGPAFHLWFLTALGLSSVIVLYLKRFEWKVLAAISALLFLTGAAFGPYRDVIGVGDINFNTRNGPFFGTAFVAIGYYLARRPQDYGLIIGLLLAVTGLGLQLAEAQFISHFSDTGFRSYDFLFGTFFYGTGMFIIAQNLRASRVTESLARFGELSLGMYCIHVLFLLLLRNYVHRENPVEDIVFIALVLVLSTLSIVALARVPFVRRVVK